MKNLPMDLLRTFVTISDLGGFSRAGAALGRSQPAISLQIQRLEDLTDIALFQRNTRRMQLTDEGAVLLQYARQILRINDEAVACFTKPKLIGEIKLGIPNEFAMSYLPELLGAFTQAYPDVVLEVTSGLSKILLDSQQAGELDVVIAIHPKPVEEHQRAWTEQLVWVGSPAHDRHTRRPVPLVVAPQGCVYRQRIIECLSGMDIPWQIVYTGTSYGGIRAAVLAGLGVTVIARSTLPTELRELSAADGFPPLRDTDIALHYDSASVSESARHLAQYISDKVLAQFRVNSLV